MIIALIIIIAYLLGSIPSGLVVGKAGYGIDIREHGSGNLGGTNAFRTLGVKAGLIVTLSDILKGTAAASVPLWFGSEFHPLLAGIFAVVGHMFPVFAKFKGGKAVATSGGVLLFYAPVLFITMLAFFFILLLLTKYVSLSSMLSGVYAVVFSVVLGDVWLIAITCVMTFFVIYRHRANISRIRNGTEPKVRFGKKAV
ncbi:glycerol-3-phosphate 1-O-acyltransferase PlsY [Metabacillus sp. KIGAM252]|uniref:Glycerol-3-phosphate acyltransferase n=1 Tax=Metabacillus flavus TaxID=2823519 RepID=A0ABS5LEL0_9BACI|nr:glycerol-3-phosphate 1-O-acyltransferase PlsY [Metabacillus flavus]MBS2969127.1 glycerol-3-phosphate 1-O-acyltransferase PlsY [Metabacillus flavus]